jgi:hypothetical protein
MNKLLTGFGAMVKPKGGRGLKAPYESTHLRVPVPLKDEIERLIEKYRESVLTGIDSDNQPGLCDYEQAVEYANSILKQKKSARQSVEKLLTAIYGRETTLKSN